ncbi:MAG: T9SS type A sorting domain-containing protein [Candidatus Delongbacteria bacterium]|nr:T9SS type A sorting domain-containing protein [Candidatus Delongbacteria bacterium]MBN2835970.1 T9SS type A sorting domain-containing protein [Candidatus Delongbacteria bacterium]
MKTIILILLLNVVSNMFASQKGEITLFEENWESYPEEVLPLPEYDPNWKTIIHPNGSYFGIWAIAHGGTRSVSHSTVGQVSGSPRDWLICKKPLVIPEYGGELSFWALSYEPQNIEIRVSETVYTDTTAFSSYLFNESFQSASFAKQVFDLTPYAGKTIYIAWKRKGPYGYAHGSNWIIDDIKMIGYTEDLEAPICEYITGNIGLVGKSVFLRAKMKDQTNIESVYGRSEINGQVSSDILLSESEPGSGVYIFEVPYVDGEYTGSVKFITRDTLGNEGITESFEINWKNYLLSENFEDLFPPIGWYNNGWKKMNQYGANNSSCAYSNYLDDGELESSPIKLTDDMQLSFYCANRYLYKNSKIEGIDTLFCELKTIGEDDWTIVTIHSPETPDESHVKYVIDLSPVSGEEIILRWRHSTNGSFQAEGALVDSILVYKNNTTAIDDDVTFANTAKIIGAYPNPFNPTTTISFETSMNGNVRLTVFNSKGEFVSELINKNLNKGNHKVNFDATSLPTGVFYYTLETPFESLTNKMVLVK